MREVVLRTAGVLLAGAGLVLACSSSSGDGGGGDTGNDGGTTTTGTDAQAGNDADTTPTPCTKDADCASHVCNQATGQCAPPSCNDGVKNAAEIDIDCGASCNKCDVGKGCAAAADCGSGVCSGGKCAAPTNTDGVKNGNETGVDCGGTGNPKCADGQGCKTRDDCTSDYCKAGVCTATSPADGIKDGNETDVDCGGEGNPRCADGLMCLVDTDCKSDVCLDTGAGLQCQAPSPTDGKKNGDETDVDCGGSSGVGCAMGKSCLVSGDCASSGCNYNHVCAGGRSCTAHYGGDTCGLGGEGGQGPAQWEDCCTTADVTVTYSGATATEKAGVTHMDKYQVTAGRMRVFLESIGYNVRGFVQQARADGKIPNIFTGSAANQTHSLLEAEWDPYLPTSFDGTNDAAEIADCDQGYFDYTNDTCCLTVKPIAGTTCPAGATYIAGGNGQDEKCHYWDSVNNVCNGGNTGIYAGTYTAVKRHLGGTIFRRNSQNLSGCFPGAPGTHAFRFPDGVHDPQSSTNAEQSQEVYDTKSMNCVDYLVAQAFCVWDGGRLASINEWRTAWYGSGGAALTIGQHTQPYGSTYTNPDGTPSSTDQNPGSDAYNPPWWNVVQLDPKAQVTGTFSGRRFPTATDVGLRASMPYCPAGTTGCPVNTPLFPDLGHTIEYANWKYSYEYPNLVSTDYIVFISAPGRTKGRGQYGHADIIGNAFELESSITYQPDKLNARGETVPSVFNSTHTWSGNGSWEVHDYGPGGGSSMLLNKYGKLGFRCAHK